MRRLLHWLIRAALLGIIIWTSVILLHAPARYRTLALVGRGGGCSPADVEGTAARLQLQFDTQDDIAKGLRLLRREGSYQLWRSDLGEFWVPDRTAQNLSEVLSEQETRLYEGAGCGLRSRDIVLDCGAHVGAFTRRALAAGARLVVAAEISPDNLECLRRTFASEIASGRVVVLSKGVWDKEETVQTRVRPGTSLTDTVALDGDGFVPGPPVALTTIDKLAEELNLERIDFIKLDVEGAEEKALIGAERTLRRWKPRLAVATENQPDQPDRVKAQVLRTRADYQVACGYCFDHWTRLQPHVMYFY